MKPLHAVIYVRVSTEKQAENGVSLDTQEQVCQEWAYRNNVIPIRVFREEGVSAKTLKRPKMQEMLDFLKSNSGKVDYCIVYDMSRLTRDNFDFVDIMRIFSSIGVQLRDSSSHLESSPSDQLIQAIGVATSQYDNQIKSMRVSDTMKARALDGYRMHKAPYGLRNTRGLDGKPKIIEIPEISQKITKVITAFSQGLYTRSELVEYASQIGLTTASGHKPNFQFIDKLLKQPLYAGLERNKFTDYRLINSAFAGIVPEYVFYANQELLETSKSRKQQGYRRVHPDYPLRNFIICSACKTPLRGSAPTGNSGKRYPRYHCTNPNCKNKSIKPDELHQLFLELLGGLELKQMNTKLINTLILRVWKEEIKSSRLNRDHLISELDAVRSRKIDVADQFSQGLIDFDEKSALTQRLSEQQSRVERELSLAESQIGTSEAVIEYAISHICNAAKLWVDASPNMKLIYQRIVFPDGIEFDLVNKKFGTMKLSNIYRFVASVAEEKIREENSMVIPRRIELRFPD